jgi:hypothetical protein
VTLKKPITNGYNATSIPQAFEKNTRRLIYKKTVFLYADESMTSQYESPTIVQWAMHRHRVTRGAPSAKAQATGTACHAPLGQNAPKLHLLLLTCKGILWILLLYKAV